MSVRLDASHSRNLELTFTSWFAYISPSEPCLLSDVLITPAHSLCNQVHEHYLPRLLAHLPNNITTEHEADARNRLFNVDGVGISWYTTSAADFRAGKNSNDKQGSDLRPAVIKSVQPPLGNMNLRSICDNTETRCCFAHIRATSASAVTEINNHPFLFGRLAFMHNGVVSDFQSIKREVGLRLDSATFANITGSTDSEHVAGLFVHYLSGGRGKESWDEEYSVQQMHEALLQAVKTVIEIQQQVLGAKAKPNSLNLAVTDGTKMVAYRFRNHAEEQPPSLYYSTTAGVTLNRKYPDHPDGIDLPAAHRESRLDAEQHGPHVIVASEPSTYKEDEWTLIEKNQAVLVDRNGSPQVVDIPYEKSWNAQDVL